MSRQGLVAFSVLVVGAAVGLYLYASSYLQLVVYRDGKLQIADFANYIFIARAFWFEGLSSPYDNMGAIHVLERVAGGTVHASMPSAVSPVFPVYLLPFVLIAQYDLTLSYALWGALGIGLFGLLCWCGIRSTLRAQSITLLCAAICSLVFVFTLLAGQTALIGVGLLAILLLQPLLGATWQGAITALLFIKLPYAIPAVLWLVARRRWRAMLVAGGIVAASFGLFLIQAQRSWVGDMISTVALYSERELPPMYRDAISFETMNNLRSVLAKSVPFPLLISVTNMLLCGGIILAGILALRGKAEHAALASIAAWLLFAPYVAAYEDLFLVVPLALAMFRSGPGANQSLAWLSAPLLFVALNQRLLALHLGLAICFASKSLVLLLSLVLIQRAGANSGSEASGKR